MLSEKEYNQAVSRYEQIKHSKKGHKDHAEKMRLVSLISEYENANTHLPKIDQSELDQIRRDEFGYKL